MIINYIRFCKILGLLSLATTIGAQTLPRVTLSQQVTGTLPVSNGGIGATTLTANKVLVGNGTSTILQPTNLHWDNTNSRLGIGTTTPTEKLDVDGNLKGLSFISYADSSDHVGSGSFQAMDFNLEPPQASTGNLLARFRVFTNFASSRALVAFQKFRGSLALPEGVLNNDVIGAIGFAPANAYGNAGTATALVEAYADADATLTEAAARLSFVTGSTLANRTERLTIKSDGKIGIGTSAPLSKFHIAQETSTLNPLARIGVHTVQPFAVDNIVYGSNGFFNNDSSSIVSIETGRVAWFQQFCGSSIFRGSIDTILTTQKVTNQVTQAAFTPFGLHIIPLGNSINDNPNLSAEQVAQYNYYKKNLLTVKDSLFVIDSIGKVGVGKSTPGSQLHIKSANANDALLVEDDSGACEAQPTSTGLTWSCSSDQRLKTDIQIPSAVLNYVKNIPLKDYTVIKTAERVMGPIAQELLETYPELVTTGEDGYYRVSSLGSWTLVKAIQEQQAIIETQEQKITDLETTIQALITRIINLENK